MLVTKWWHFHCELSENIFLVLAVKLSVCDPWKIHQEVQEKWENGGFMQLREPSVRAVSGGEDEVGRRVLPRCDCSSESKVSAELPAPPSHFPWELHTRAGGPTKSPLTAVICGQVASPSARSDPAPLVRRPTGLLPRQPGPGLLLVPYVLCFF